MLREIENLRKILALTFSLIGIGILHIPAFAQEGTEPLVATRDIGLIRVRIVTQAPPAADGTTYIIPTPMGEQSGQPWRCAAEFLRQFPEVREGLNRELQQSEILDFVRRQAQQSEGAVETPRPILRKVENSGGTTLKPIVLMPLSHSGGSGESRQHSADSRSSAVSSALRLAAQDGSNRVVIMAPSAQDLGSPTRVNDRTIASDVFNGVQSSVERGGRLVSEVIVVVNDAVEGLPEAYRNRLTVGEYTGPTSRQQFFRAIRSGLIGFARRGSPAPVRPSPEVAATAGDPAVERSALPRSGQEEIYRPLVPAARQLLDALTVLQPHQSRTQIFSSYAEFLGSRIHSQQSPFTLNVHMGYLQTAYSQPESLARLASDALIAQVESTPEKGRAIVVVPAESTGVGMGAVLEELYHTRAQLKSAHPGVTVEIGALMSYEAATAYANRTQEHPGHAGHELPRADFVLVYEREHIRASEVPSDVTEAGQKRSIAAEIVGDSNNHRHCQEARLLLWEGGKPALHAAAQVLARSWAEGGEYGRAVLDLRVGGVLQPAAYATSGSTTAASQVGEFWVAVQNTEKGMTSGVEVRAASFNGDHKRTGSWSPAPQASSEARVNETVKAMEGALAEKAGRLQLQIERDVGAAAEIGERHHAQGEMDPHAAPGRPKPGQYAQDRLTTLEEVRERLRERITKQYHADAKARAAKAKPRR